MITDVDTICAISSPPGVGGIAVIRISGPQAFEISDRIWKGRRLSGVESHTAHLGTVMDSEGTPLDQAVATVFRGPHSFTGEDTVEFSVHGSKWVQRELIETLVQAGARIAGPGEFTMRAFTSGNLGLTQAEAVADIIDSNSRAAHRLAMSQLRGSFARRLKVLHDRLLEAASLLELELDFSEEHEVFADREQIRQIVDEILAEVTRLGRSFRTGAAIKNGIPVAIIGQTNAGKSSLLNALLDDERAIVSDIHGTTRDTIEETIEIGDYTFRFIDTAGIRETGDEIEKIGITRSMDAINHARIILHVIDPSQTEDTGLSQHLSQVMARPDSPHLIRLINKADIHTGSADTPETIHISARTGQGLDNLRKTLVDIIADEQRAADADSGIIITNARHARTLAEAAKHAQLTLDALDTALPPDLTAEHLRDTLSTLSTLTGQITSQDILTTIFTRFCIGK